MRHPGSKSPLWSWPFRWPSPWRRPAAAPAPRAAARPRPPAGHLGQLGRRPQPSPPGVAASAGCGTRPWQDVPVAVTRDVAVPPVPVITAVRTAAHPECGYDRIVVDLIGPVPGYSHQLSHAGHGRPVRPAIALPAAGSWSSRCARPRPTGPPAGRRRPGGPADRLPGPAGLGAGRRLRGRRDPGRRAAGHRARPGRGTAWPPVRGPQAVS